MQFGHIAKGILVLFVILSQYLSQNVVVIINDAELLILLLYLVTFLPNIID